MRTNELLSLFCVVHQNRAFNFLLCKMHEESRKFNFTYLCTDCSCRTVSRLRNVFPSLPNSVIDYRILRVSGKPSRRAALVKCKINNLT